LSIVEGYLESGGGDVYSFLEPVEPELDLDLEALVRRSLGREESRVETELEEVERLLEDRRSIHEGSVSEVESRLEVYVDRLEQEYRLRGDSEKASELKSRVLEFYRRLRELERERWLDVQDLERQRRDLLRELERLGHEVVDLRIRRASLEEVFVDMTRTDEPAADPEVVG